MAKNPRNLVEYQNDHDLLIELRTEMRGMRDDIAELKTDVVVRVASLEADRVSQEEMQILRNEIVSLKLWRSMLLGAWGVCTIILIPLAFSYFP